ncbi:Chalcone-flavanone isomerase [Geosmithia morbida]|uniref:Chalcone-flavanone isomerase n=1 Tax=Geosmithia morbida TaxID=1094350 RepID=A0A9P5D4X7_9HYPO|nr:Chalcone-flavanone isomerase [Geosmithia morbida]KAF4121939.1 Chalcone-flavanone isomerase [Geosmithia morbida]
MLRRVATTTRGPALRTRVRAATSPPAYLTSGCRAFRMGRGVSRVTQEFDLNKLNDQRRDYDRNRTAFLAAGAGAGIVSFIYTSWKLKTALDDQSRKQKVECDSAVPNEMFKTEGGEKRKVVLHDDEGREIVPTGNSVVTTFPRTLDVKLPSEPKPEGPIAASITDDEGAQFTLVGLGTRSVTFIGIQVYVVGFYVATQDVAKLQHYLVKKVNPVATTLISSEKEALRASLMHETEGEATWNEILRDAGCRTLFRITPVKDTDLHHLRDGFVRAITGRTRSDPKAYADEQFSASLKDFKAMFNRGSVPKAKELILCRDQAGKLSVMYNDQGVKTLRKDIMGAVDDERISRLLWLNYLAGAKVASEGARQSIVDGVLEFVERPVGTVATQVL